MVSRVGPPLSSRPGQRRETIPPHDGDGTLHLCFAIPLAELDAWDRHLAVLGIPVESRVVQSLGGTSLYFRDPDGHSLEVAVPGLWATY